jgi:hypothetical protein
VFPTPGVASLLPKLRDQYAEFLDPVSLVHLRLLASPTCVGLRYGRPPPSAAGFSRVSTPGRSVRGRPLPSHSALGLAPYRLGRPSTWPPALRSTVPCGFNETRTGPESSPASHRLRLWGLALGPASPCADCHGAGTLGLTVSGVFTPICAYSFRHPHFWSLQPNASARPSPLPERSPTPHGYPYRPSFGGPLNPDHSRRTPTGLVSYYALFKGMAASKPTSQLSQ